MQIAYYDQYGRFGLYVGRKTYEYYGVEPEAIKKIKRYIKLGLQGKLMQFMKKYSRTDIMED